MSLRNLSVRSLSLAALVAGAALTSSASATIIAGWSITTAFPTGAGNIPTGQTYSVGAADQGVQTDGSELSAFHTNALALYTSPAGNGSQYSFSSNRWQTGDYYEARMSTLGYSDIEISWDQARSSTGPSSFELVMSTDGGATFEFVTAYTVLQSGGGGSPGTWSTNPANYNPIYTTTLAVAGADDQALVIFRFRAAGNPSSEFGSNRIDNVVISSIPTPGALALLGLAGLAARRRR
jgi:hypothetical protein